MMLSLDNPSSFLQDTVAYTNILPSFCNELPFDEDVSFDGNMTEPDLSLAVEMIEAEEKSFESKGTSPMHPNPNSNVDLSDIVDIISQSGKFSINNDLLGGSLLDEDLILDSNDLLTPSAHFQQLPPESLPDKDENASELVTVSPLTLDTLPLIKKVPEEERPSKKYPHILSTLQGTYKGLPQSRPSVPPQVSHSYIPIIQNTQTLGVIPSITQNITQCISTINTRPANIAIAPHGSAPSKSTSIKVSGPITQTTAVPINQSTRVVAVTHSAQRIGSPQISIPVTIPSTSVPQATVPSLPPPIHEPKRYIVLPKTTVSNGQMRQQTVHFTNTNNPQQKTVFVHQSLNKLPSPTQIQQNNTIAGQRITTSVPSPSGSVCMDEDECLNIPKTVCTKANSEHIEPSVVIKKDEETKSSHSESSDTEVDFVKRGRKKMTNKVTSQKIKLKKREHFQDLKVEIQDWECKNTRLKYEIYQLEKEMKMMTEQLENHQCKINSQTHNLDTTTTTTTTTTSQHPPEVEAINIISPSQPKRLKKELNSTSEENQTPTEAVVDVESSLMKRRSKRKRKASSRMLM